MEKKNIVRKIDAVLPDKVGDIVLEALKKHYIETYLKKYAKVFPGTEGMELGGVVVIEDFNTLNQSLRVRSAAEYFSTNGFSDDGLRWIKTADVEVITLERPKSSLFKNTLGFLLGMAIGAGALYGYFYYMGQL
jgi:hypothetical protein